MNPDLHDNSWMHGGTSLIWDADALTRICPAQSVRSLREFLRLYEDGWPEAALKLINGRTLVVAGLESAMDTLPPERAVEWLEKTVYPAILDFQEEVADGGREGPFYCGWIPCGGPIDVAFTQRSLRLESSCRPRWMRRLIEVDRKLRGRTPSSSTTDMTGWLLLELIGKAV